jgi:glycosyltransferase involved in cell wall biosynthesis
MKVLHLSALDGETGAGIAAARIHEGLRARGVESSFCVAFPSVGLEGAFTPEVTVADRIARLVRRTVSDWIVNRHLPGYDYVLSTGLVGFDVQKILDRERPDILQLHWIAGNSFRLASLFGVRVPVVWRLSDMWPFCGLEHLQPDTKKYIDMPRGANEWTYPRFDVSEHIRRRKKTIYRSVRELRLVCASRWMASEAARSALLGDREIELIPTSCDTDLFSPKTRGACREVLGLSPDKVVVLVGATSMRTRWKGLDLFLEALNEIAKNPGEQSGAGIQIVTFGKEPFAGPSLGELASVVHLGEVRDRRLMSMIFNSADVFVAPSRMENLANTVLESLSCGTPVVAFDLGGMPDMIDHRINGFLARPFDTSNLAEGIRWAIKERGNQKIRSAARNKVLYKFSFTHEIDRYIDLYGRLLVSQK